MASDPRDNLAVHHTDNSGNPVFYNPADGEFHTNTGEQTGHFISGKSDLNLDVAGGAEKFFTQPGKRPLDRYNNVYPTDYKTGAQVSVFFGPVYIEECIQVSWTTASGDTPIYSYLSRYWNTLVQGHHIIQGQFAIPYKETDYIYRSLKEFESLQAEGSRISTVSDVISRGRDKFFNTLLGYRRRTSTDGDVILDDKSARSRSIEDITKYVDYVVNRRTLDIEHNTGLFDIAIIYGNYQEKDFALKSFVDCKIIGSGQQVQQDDGHTIEVYNFIARQQKLPERRREVITIDGIKADPVVVLADLEKAIREVGKTLEIWPSMETSAVDRFIPGVLDSVDNIALVGLPNEGTGIYGHDVHLFEPQWLMYYDKLIPLPEPLVRTSFDMGADTVKLFDEDKVIRDIVDNRPVIPNDGILYIEERPNLPYINAISNAIGNGNIGSGIPPTRIPMANFSWHEVDNKMITGSVLWNGLISSEIGYWIKYPTT